MAEVLLFPTPCPSLFHEMFVCLLGPAASSGWFYTCYPLEGQITSYSYKNVFPEDISCVWYQMTGSCWVSHLYLLDVLPVWVWKTACRWYADKLIFYRMWKRHWHTECTKSAQECVGIAEDDTVIWATPYSIHAYTLPVIENKLW